MKKILLATTILVGTAGFAAAEITLSGSAVMGIGDNGSETVSKMETYVTFAGAGETDGGLAFGMSSTIGVYSTTDGLNNDGTSVFVSGAFGKLSFGSVSEADEVATLSDIGGVAGLGVDNVAEAFTGDSAKRATHDINYTYSADALTVSLSTRLGSDGSGDAYAVGAKYTVGDYYVGVGYNDDNESDADTAAVPSTNNPVTNVVTLGTPAVVVADNAGTVTSLYAGGTFGAVTVNAMYSTWDADAGQSADAFGLFAAYKMDALTLKASYADNDLVDEAAYGLGASYDLGGGASVDGGIANVNDTTVWEAGVNMAF